MPILSQVDMVPWGLNQNLLFGTTPIFPEIIVAKSNNLFYNLAVRLSTVSFFGIILSEASPTFTS